MKHKPEVGDLVICKKFFSGKKTGMVIATKSSNCSENLEMSNCYPTVYYVLSIDGDVEGPLFQSEVVTILFVVS